MNKNCKKKKQMANLLNIDDDTFHKIPYSALVALPFRLLSCENFDFNNRLYSCQKLIGHCGQ